MPSEVRPHVVRAIRIGSLGAISGRSLKAAAGMLDVARHGVGAIALHVACIFLAAPATADLVSPYGGETAPNFLDISVLKDRVRITLEMEPADYPLFVGEDDGSGRSLSERTGDTILVTADGVPLAVGYRSVDIRPRKLRATAATALVPQRPRSDEVVYAELEYPFSGSPEELTFSPPLDAEGMPTVSLGLLVQHLGVPVTDYRYLSRKETLFPDWNDPWFSAFENPNLTRHHKSPLMSFLSMEPREVRHEIIVRLRDLEGWTDLGLGAAGTVGSAQMDAIAPHVSAFLRDRNPVVIDGEDATPTDIRIMRVAVGAEGLRVLDDAEEVDRATALLGVVLSYPREALAREVEMTWELFPDGLSTVPVTLTDPAGGVPAQVRRDDPVVRWSNYLTDWSEPETRPVTLASAATVNLPLLAMALSLGAAAAAWVGFRGEGRHRIVPLALAVCAVGAAVASAPITTRISLPWRTAPDAETARQLMSDVLENVGTAMLETRPEGFATALSAFVPAERAVEVGAELRRGLSVTLPSGALARTDEILDLTVERIDPAPDGTGSQILATWTASMSGGHWGHMHRRLVTYRGLVDVSRQADRWYVDGLTILSAQMKT